MTKDKMKNKKKKIEVIELKEGNYLFKGEEWNIETSPEEAEEFFSAWRTGKLKIKTKKTTQRNI